MFRRVPWIAVALAAAPVFAQSPGSLPELVSRGQVAAPAAAEFLQTRVEPREVYESVGAVVKSIHWYSRLSEALQSATDQQKPIVWISALGDLKGYT